MVSQSLFPWFEETKFTTDFALLTNVVTDRGSKFSASGGRIWWSKQEVKERLSTHLADKFFQKATHNSYAYRYKDQEGFIIEGKDDDGETWAGQVILSQLQRENIIDGIVIVTRYYGGKKLFADRFRHILDTTKAFMNDYRK